MDRKYGSRDSAEVVLIRVSAYHQYCRTYGNTSRDWGIFLNENQRYWANCDSEYLCSDDSIRWNESTVFVKSQNLSWAVAREMEDIEQSLEPLDSLSFYRLYWNYFAHVVTEMVVRWGVGLWLLLSLVLFSLAGNFRSLIAFRRLRSAKEPVHLHQVAIVATDIVSTLTGLYFLLVTHALPRYSLRLHTGRWETTALIPVITTLLMGRWVFLGSLLDRREALIRPLVYRGFNHPRRVRRLLLASLAAATPIALTSAYPTQVNLLASFSTHPTTPQQMRHQLCRERLELGFFGHPVNSPSWILLLHMTEETEDDHYVMPKRFLFFLSVLLATDVTIGNLAQVQVFQDCPLLSKEW